MNIYTSIKFDSNGNNEFDNELEKYVKKNELNDEKIKNILKLTNKILSKVKYNKTYENYKHLSSGDDDFLMHAFFNHNAEACRYAMHPDALVSTKPEDSLKTFFAQRARWASKRKHYLFPYNKYLFALMGLKFLTYWALLFFMVINCFYWGSSTPWVLFLLLYVSELAFAKCLREVLKLNYLSIFILPLYQFYLPFVLIYSKLFRIQWKGRIIDAK